MTSKQGTGVAFRAPGLVTSIELANRGLQESGESARARDSPGRLGVTRRVGEHLLDVDVHLAEERRRNRVAVALVGQERHPPLQAERLEDRLRDPERQAVERPDQDDAVEALALGLQAIVHRWDNLTEERGGDMLGGLLEEEVQMGPTTFWHYGNVVGPSRLSTP